MLPFSYLVTIITYVTYVTTVNGDLWGYTLKNVIDSCDRIGGAGWCTKVIGKFEKAIFTIYGPSKNPLCFEEPIERCTCIEMLFRTTSLVPSFPNIDEEDVRKLFRRSSEKYHPQNTNSGDKPFLFLQKCADVLSIPLLRKEYLKRIKSRLKDCKDDETSDAKCRNGILRRHKEFFQEYKDIEKYMEKGDDIFNNLYRNSDSLLTERMSRERLFVFLDDSGSMSGTGCQKGHKFLESIQNRLIDTPSNIHFVGSKTSSGSQENYGSRLLVNDSVELTEDNVVTYVLDKWTGSSGGTYLWEYIWETMKNETVKDCEILIVTDGGDNESGGEFHGLEGFNKLMMNIKESNEVLCRTFVYCVSNACKQEVRKSSKDKGTYIDLAWASGGFYCDENVEDCHEILTATHYTRTKMANVTKGEHLRMIASGKAKMLSWEEDDAGILKMTDTEKDEL